MQIEDYNFDELLFSDEDYDDPTRFLTDLQLEVATSTGHEFFLTHETRFIIHTSTIPLAHIWNVVLNKRQDLLEHDEVCEDCMFGVNRLINISRKCPCLDLPQEVHEVCFLNYLRSLKKFHEYDPYRWDRTSDFAFCKDSDSIFSQRYSRPMRNYLNVTGFHQISTPEQLQSLLSGLYWSKYSVSSIVKIFNKIKVSFDFFRAAFKQTIYTINSLLLRLLYICCDFNYKEIAIKTAMLFDELFADYLAPPVLFQGSFLPANENQSIFMDIKMFHKFMKQNFNSADNEIRLKALNYTFLHSTLEDFYKPIADVINSRVNEFFLVQGEDYTTTLGWKFTFTLLTQTRGLGYLPQRVALYQDQEYRSKINTIDPTPSITDLNLIRGAIISELEAARIPENVLFQSQDKLEYDDEIFFHKVLSETDMPVKKAASYDTILQEGGKLEDCRLLIKMAIDQNLKIPIRDLRNNNVLSYFTARDCKSYSKICFWLSYQLAMEYINLINSPVPRMRLTYFKGLGTEALFPLDKVKRFLNAKILHIQEPAKQRNLTKSTSELTWFLTPMGKMLQSVLSSIPDHYVGLRSTTDAWKFQQRLHPRNEGHFIFKEGKVQNFTFTSSDWTESTDNINKMIGLYHLKILAAYVGAPAAYFEMVMALLSLPQPVEEVIRNDLYKYETPAYTGYIRRGFMMGNPITKSILHLLHVSEKNLALTYLYKKYGIILRKGERLPALSTTRINFVKFLNDPY
jgi:hypothetical protein